MEPSSEEARIEPYICRPCTELETMLSAAIEEPIPPTGKPVLRLGPMRKELTKNSRTKTCGSCEFFRQLAPRYKKNYNLELKLFDRLLEDEYDFGQALPGRNTPFVVTVREKERLPFQEILGRGILTYYPSSRPSSFEGLPQVCPVNRNTIDYHEVQRWLQDCALEHSCGFLFADQNALPYIYLIDCTTGRIIKSYLSKKYVALSYVWGKGTSLAPFHCDFNAEPPQGILDLENAPLTVRDAAQAARSLGINHLWIDKYCIGKKPPRTIQIDLMLLWCIDQNNQTETRNMIQNMDKIYAQAWVTLVAMFGENSDAGLPGVSTVNRLSQPRFQTPRGVWISSLPTISTVSQASKWATRGWTYQEARLSRRCLIFTEYQLYFVCERWTLSESTPYGVNTGGFARILNSSCLNSSLFGREESAVKGYAEDRLHYSRRDLTNESDMLHAFRGILSRTTFRTFWGVSITAMFAKMDADTGFALGLMWVRRSWQSALSTVGPRAVRRAGFPTWSWTSVTGGIAHDAGTQFYTPYLKEIRSASLHNYAHIKFWLYLHSQPIPLGEAVSRYNTMIPEESHHLLVEGDIITLSPDWFGRHSSSRIWYSWYSSEKENNKCSFPVSLDLDADIDSVKHSISSDESVPTQDALLIMEAKPPGIQEGMRVMVLILLKWTAEGCAQRIGLVGGFAIDDRISDDKVKALPRKRMKFTLC
ncbi:hypothetical protein B0J11DRAFT_55689 [Dendryphion nanum]|uniref:Heterokaryon incompatibility domain-containing protein n=1 Tax=Dendryphion nanum TaxID=256645 RepID=A0A9P9IHQ4_9PLEO|nr:hypothetical protein B0J11DRAFT_55689 [Dendryphion nanum]